MIGDGHPKDPYNYTCVCGGQARYNKRTGEIECLVCGRELEEDGDLGVGLQTADSEVQTEES